MVPNAENGDNEREGVWIGMYGDATAYQEVFKVLMATSCIIVGSIGQKWEMLCAAM